MKVLIFEGIATSGKSTVTAGLQRALPGLKVLLADESETHIPIMNDRTDTHLGFFKDLIARMSSANPDVLIFDRLYLTQALRADCNISEYAEIEDMLRHVSSLTIFLNVDEHAIEDRITSAAAHRGPEYFESRGATSHEKAQYYIDQQRKLLEMLSQSTLQYKIMDTTTHDYEKVVHAALTFINKK